MSEIRRQELHCHHCNGYVQFDVDMTLNGNHVLECPNCGHEHCRVVKDGEITSERWDSRNGNAGLIINVSSTTSYTSTSTYDTYSSTTASGVNYFMYQSWLDTSGATS